MNECAIEWIKNGKHAGVTAYPRSALKGKLLRLAIQYPDDVKIIKENDDGSVFAHVPIKWIRVQKPKKMNLTDEEKAKRAEIMRRARNGNINYEDIPFYMEEDVDDDPFSF